MKKHLLIIAFVLFATLTSTTVIAQVANQPSGLMICEVIFDGSAEFDLSLTESEIIGGQDPTDLFINYYETQPEADAGLNAIVLPESYFNLANPQIIYARLEDSSNGNFDITSFEIEVVNSLTFTEVSIFSQCDDEVVDGMTEFDLNSQNETITNGNNNLNVSYYSTQADAENATNPLPNPYTNITVPETIYVRVEGNAGDCYEVFEMVLLVVAPPTIFEPSPLEYCDPDNDGFGEFNLTDADQEVTGGIPQGNLVVTYHYTVADAVNGVLPLSSPYLNDVPFQQTVMVRLFDQSTGCFSITTLDLMVHLSPEAITVSDLTVVDDDGDGFTTFDLTSKIPEILNGQTGIDITFYESQADADANVNVIVSPTTYFNSSNPQTIYYRMEDLINSCPAAINSFNLVAVDALIDEEPDDIFIDEGDNDGSAIFDLTINEAQMLGNQNPAIALFTYHTSFEDSDNGVNAIATPTAYQNVLNPQTIYVRLTNNNTGFYVLTSFEIETDEILGIEDDFITNLSIFPNPSTGTINIQSNLLTETVGLTIYNLQGQQLFSENKTPNNGTVQIDVSNLVTGIYFVKITSGENTVIKRVIKE